MQVATILLSENVVLFKIDEQIANNLTPTNLCARDTTIEETTISSSNYDDTRNNQNYVNGCQKRAQWAEVTDWYWYIEAFERFLV